MNRMSPVFLICLIAGDAMGAKARNIFLDSRRTEPITIGLGRSTILNFPMKPSKVVLGNQGLFAIEYVDADLAVSALSPRAHSNLFVYVEGRRFGFDLQAKAGFGDEIVIVRDLTEKRQQVRIRP